MTAKFCSPGQAAMVLLMDKFADAIGLTTDQAKEFLAGQRAVTPTMARHLAFTLGLSPQMWLNQDRIWQESRKAEEEARQARLKVETEFFVSPAAQRNERRDGRCFYCKQAIGDLHKSDCLLLSKKVQLEARVRFEAEVPAYWGKAEIETYRNGPAFCAGDLLGELEKQARVVRGPEGQEHLCLCPMVNFGYVEDLTGPFLSEK